MRHNDNQQGFSLIMAIFLVVVLGGIAVFIGRVTSLQIQSSTLNEESAMAYQAAHSGIEWGVYQAVTNSSCVANTTFTLALTVPTTPVRFANYTVKVDCTSTTATEGSDNILIYQITATATNAAVGNLRVQRQLTAIIN